MNIMLISITETGYLFRRLFCRTLFRVRSVQTQITPRPISQPSIATRIASATIISNSMFVLEAIKPNYNDSKTTRITKTMPYIKRSNTVDDPVIGTSCEMKSTIVTINAEKAPQNHYSKLKQCTKHSPLNRTNSL